jgi:carboxyl-terminal processing protease
MDDDLLPAEPGTPDPDPLTPTPIPPASAPMAPDIAPPVHEMAATAPDIAPPVHEMAATAPDTAPTLPDLAPMLPYTAPTLPETAPMPTVAAPRRGHGWTVAALVLAAVLLFGTGSLVGRVTAPETGSGSAAAPSTSVAPAPSGAAASAGAAGSVGLPSWSLLDQAYALLRANYVDPAGLDTTTLVQGAIRGLMDAVNDPGHTGYLTPQEVAARDASLAGTFVGVGAVLDIRNNATTVVRVLPNSPAEKAGLKSGEVILKVDGTPVAGLAIEQVVVKVRGPVGTPVTLDLQELDGSERTLTIIRAQIDLPLVSWALAPGSHDAVIRLESFSTGAAKALVDAIKAAKAAGAVGIVLDLRANPGGYVNEAIDVASQFLASGVVYISQDRSGRQVPHEVAGGGIATTIPLVLLVNGQTASSAEIVTGAIKDAGRATIVGETTYGTGTVVGTYPLADGSAVTIGTERWLTPKGHAIWREGLTPDQTVALAQGVNFLVPDDFSTLGSGGIAGSSDAQLQAALRSLGVAERAATGG